MGSKNLTIKLARNLLLYYKKFSLLFIFYLIVGLLGFSVLNTISHSFEEHLQLKGKEILHGDLVISSRAGFEDIESILPPDSVVQAKSVDFYSMVYRGDNSQLAKIIAIGPNYPLYGPLLLQAPRQTVLTGNNSWVSEELASQLDLKIGDSVQVGSDSYVVNNIVQSALGGGFSWAPSIYLPLQKALQSDLLGAQSLADYNLYLKVSQSTPQKIEDLAARISENLRPSSELTTALSSDHRLSRIFQRVSQYLGLFFAATFLLALGSISYLARQWLARQQEHMQLLNKIGLSQKRIKRIYLTSLVSLIAIAYTLTFFSLVFLFQGLSIWSPSWLPFPINFSWSSISSNATLFSLSFIYLFSFATMQLSFLLPSAKPTNRFPLLSRQRSFQLSSGILLSAILAKLLFDLSQSWTFAFVALGTLGAVLLALYCIYIALLWSSKHISGRHFLWTHLIKAVRHNQVTTATAFIVIAFCITLITLIGQIKNSLLDEMKLSADHPSYFLFDIQDDQIQPLEESLKKKGIGLQNKSPLVRARLTHINDKSLEELIINPNPYQKTYKRMQERGFNLSYRPSLSDSEKIVAGKPIEGPFKPTQQKFPYLSVEKRYAQRLGIDLRDQLTFEVLGLSIKGQVTNLRQVRWTSFEPNFFILFQTGILEDAPKIYLASIPPLNAEQEDFLFKTLKANFPNVSAIHIESLIQTTRTVIDQFSKGLIGLTALLFLLAFSLLIILSHDFLVQNRKTHHLLYLLGCPLKTIYKLIQLQTGLLILVAGVSGATIGTILSYAITKSYWQIEPSLFAPLTLFTLTLVLITVVLMSHFEAKSLYKKLPRSLPEG